MLLCKDSEVMIVLGAFKSERTLRTGLNLLLSGCEWKHMATGGCNKG
jgi:hypothetical protein